MEKQKRTRVRAIIFHNEQIVSMYRELNDRSFYTFPGGGMEQNETEEQCVKREVFEEFGIIIKPIKKVYVYENQISIEHFYICQWQSGEFATGNGEEYQQGQTNGVYKPTTLNITDLPTLPLMPPEVTTAFFDDYKTNGKNLRNDVKFLKAKNN